MTQFKINRGLSSNLPSKLTDGWAYFCTDTGEFYIDCLGEDGQLYRKTLNAQDAKTLGGTSLATITGQINKKVEKVEGKGLSTNDYTTKEKEKLAGIPTVTTSDNGKFLRVVNGTWAASSIPNAEGVSF